MRYYSPRIEFVEHVEHGVEYGFRYARTIPYTLHIISYHALQSSYCTTEYMENHHFYKVNQRFPWPMAMFNSNLLNYQRVSGMSGRMTMMTMIHQAISWDDYNVRNMGWLGSPKGSPMVG
jgi:hypothetical protein